MTCETVEQQVAHTTLRSKSSASAKGWGRLLASGATGLVALTLAIKAMQVLESSPFYYSDLLLWQLRLMVFGPLLMLVVTVRAKQFDFPSAIYWSWSFVFLGLAPCFQIARQAFPWKAVLSPEVVQESQALVLLSHVAFAGSVWVVRWRGRVRRVPSRTGRSEAMESASVLGAVRNRRRLMHLGVAYLVCSSLFILLMAGALFNARSVFRDRVLEISSLPLGGTLYFVVTAGAIVVPGALLACRRHGVPVPMWLVCGVWVAAALVTNPLVGSRFLTGSFLVATAVALFYRSAVLRLIPIASVVLLVIVFPSLDVLRGDGTGSQEIAVLSVEDSLLDYDFDAFEMGAREVSMSESMRDTLPSPVTMLVAPFARWVPILSRPFLGNAGGQAVAEATGMEYTNVSMPLWAEGHLVAGAVGTLGGLAALGYWVGLLSRRNGAGISVPQVAALPGTTALLFIVLRGSIYEVLGYLALAVLVYGWLSTTPTKR